MCERCKGRRYVSVRVPWSRGEYVLEPCYSCNPVGRDTRSDPPVRTRPVAAGEWEREFVDVGGEG